MKRVVGLILLAVSVVFVVSVWAAETTKPGEIAKKYPPYPDVWDWVIPYTQRATQYLQADLQADGDVRISYELKSKELKKRGADILEAEAHGITFFAHQRVESHEGMILPVWRVTLTSGKILESVFDVIKDSKSCFARHDRRLLLNDAQGELIARTYLFYVLSKPKRFTVREDCYDGVDFTYQVEAMRGSLVPLKDGTFLVVDGDHGLVIRFDEQFKTKSTLLNRRIFVDDLRTFGAQEGYGSREEGNRDWQRYEDDLYRHLMDVKGGK